MPGFDGTHQLTVQLSSEVLNELRVLLSTPSTVAIPNEYAIEALAKKKVKPVLSIEEKARIQHLVSNGRGVEATKFLTETRIRKAKLELLRANRGALVRDLLIDSLLREAIAHRKEKK